MSSGAQEPQFPLTEGQILDSLTVFKETLRAWSVTEHFSYRITHSDKQRVMAKCRSMSSCPFYIRCNYVGSTDQAKIVKVTTEHTCIGSAPTLRPSVSRMSWLLRELPKLLKIERTTSVKTIIDTIRLHFQEMIEARQAQRVKAFMIHDSMHQHEDQFQLIPAYFETLCTANSELYYDVTVDETSFQFRRVFVCPEPSRGAFVFGLPFLALDGTFLKTRFRQTLLVAVSRDTNNDGMLLAWAIVESESISSWTYFLDHLLEAIPEVNSSDTVIISDRDKGLVSKEVDERIPLVTRAWCCWHIAQNIRRHHGDAAEKVFWRLARATDEVSWNAEFQDLKMTQDGQAAVDYLMDIDPKKWATRFFTGCRYGHLTSNIAEQMNNVLRFDRELPTVDLLDTIWNRTMVLRSDRREAARTWLIVDGTKQLQYTPWAHRLVDAAVKWARSNTVQIASVSDVEARVVQQDELVRIVNVKDRRCSCGRFQDFNFPCGHAASAIFAVRQLIL